jgi:4-carboxymuconolactone decarboxylase
MKAVAAMVLAAGMAATLGAKEMTKRQEAMISVAAYTAAGKLPQLRAAFKAGLDAGWTVDELKEACVQLYAYCGFPRSLNALAALMEIAPGKGAEGGEVKVGLLKEGTAVQAKLCGGPVKGPLMDFAPEIDTFLKAHLFGDIFAGKALDAKTRELVTVAALANVPEAEAQLRAHCGIARNAGCTAEEVAEIADKARRLVAYDVFPKGQKLTQYFTGDAWCEMLTTAYDTPVYNVTFAPGTRNYWHSHAIGQVLLCTAGHGFYQERGKPARSLHPGDVVNIPPDTEHWHGAAPDSAFVHIGLSPNVKQNANKWLEPVSDTDYKAATDGVK